MNAPFPHVRKLDLASEDPGTGDLVASMEHGESVEEGVREGM